MSTDKNRLPAVRPSTRLGVRLLLLLPLLQIGHQFSRNPHFGYNKSKLNYTSFLIVANLCIINLIKMGVSCSKIFQIFRYEYFFCNYPAILCQLV
jgi:hypothetical protein